MPNLESRFTDRHIICKGNCTLEFCVMGEKWPHSALTDGIEQVVECGSRLCQVWGHWCDRGPLSFTSKFFSLKWDDSGTHFLALLWGPGQGWFYYSGHRAGQSVHQFHCNCHGCVAWATGRKGSECSLPLQICVPPISRSSHTSRLWVPCRMSPQACISTCTIMPHGK